ncbi:glycosyltransferase [Spirulina major CS-329]|uniref:glycosyltransferase n=1 Tax=Spirulina TaxID=1154 RepID=UPI00232CAFBD|nr:MULTISPECIES: glycosyltransferase [Spirulina]MDB9493414.1 glycosyltransferase [Spirulina subsalsa CS-330]MDB9502406.1 glycosyltransferase [Spirulina major CS-329]
MSIKRLAIFTHGIEGGAFTNLGTTLVRGFTELGYPCDLVVLRATAEEKARYPDVNVVSLDVPRAIAAIGALRNYLRRARPDVLISMPWYFNVVAVWAKLLAFVPTRVIITEHNIISLESGIELNRERRMQLMPFLMRHTYPFAAGLIAVCTDTLTDLRDTLRIDPNIPKIAIANPIHLHRVQTQAQQTPRHPWFTPKDQPVILTVARLAKQKQLDLLIRAFAAATPDLPARLLIFGEGQLRGELTQLCEQLGVRDRVDLAGFTANPYPYMQACDLFVLASAWEGCPLALSEALACGSLVLTTDAPGGAKELIDYGEAGLLVPMGNQAALTKTLRDVLVNPDIYQPYRPKGQARAQALDYLGVCRQYLDFARSL